MIKTHCSLGLLVKFEVCFVGKVEENLRSREQTLFAWSTVHYRLVLFYTFRFSFLQTLLLRKIWMTLRTGCRNLRTCDMPPVVSSIHIFRKLSKGRGLLRLLGSSLKTWRCPMWEVDSSFDLVRKRNGCKGWRKGGASNLLAATISKSLDSFIVPFKGMRRANGKDKGPRPAGCSLTPGRGKDDIVLQ